VITTNSSGEKYCGARFATSAEVRGVASGILISTRLPAAKAAVAAMTARTTGPFHGTAMPTTPNGCACTVVRRPNGLPALITGRGFIHRPRLRRMCAKSLIGAKTSMQLVVWLERVPKSAFIASAIASTFSNANADIRSIRLRRSANDGGPSRRNAAR
jgi:hypothetical protein